ncbi:hypothetical protein L5515_007502 [Caenorhabditis briggsae]|uniref:Uncharacterized protein n=1 Tax=Caenorhabditis briggsae TaxID=6238 RepID=A0AAE9F3E1_CAEBR|nr:hypothetical protein L5515_007502 [Caenorhabditis briggsae]
MFSSCSAVILFTVFSVSAATGHLRLEITASDHCSLHLKTSSSFQSILLTMGTPRIVSFHPKIDQETLEITFSRKAMTPQTHLYQMKKASQVNHQTFIFKDTVLLVQSYFECDTGFYGDYCSDDTTTTSTTTTTTTTTPEATTTIGTTTPATTRRNVFTESAPIQTDVSANSIHCGSLIVVIIILLVLICIVFALIKPKQQAIYIQPQIPSPTPTKCKITIEDSRCNTPESVRYTACPIKSVTISL